MGKLAIFATIEVQPGTRDQAVQILLRHRERCLRDEVGTLQFDVLVPSDKPVRPQAPVALFASTAAVRIAKADGCDLATPGSFG